MSGSYLLEVRNLTRLFYANNGFSGMKKIIIKAVDNVSFSIKKGMTLGLVGESGCGKTTLGRTILRLFEPTSGEIYFDGQNITNAYMKPYRKRMQMIFQDPHASLDPRMTVEDIIGEPLDIHKLAKGKDRRERIHGLLEMVGLNSGYSSRYPHEFSGGQRQRIGIARALAVEPELIICDEPVSALDVSIQAQIINLLQDFQRELGITYLFIAHNLSLVRHISDRVGVMYLGKLVELADGGELYNKPQHPYTKALLSAVPAADPIKCRNAKRVILEGEVPDPVAAPKGCRFRTRCHYAEEICKEAEPEFYEAAPGHFCACHLVMK